MNLKLEYRVFYDSNTKDCIRKEGISSDEMSDEPYVVVTESEYREVEFCPKFFVTRDNKVKRKPVDFTEKKLLELTINKTSMCSLTDNNIFVSNTGDYWKLREYD